MRLTMIRNTKFWLSLAAFQIAFAAAVFAVTRHYYQSSAVTIGVERSPARAPAVPAWPDPITGGVNPARVDEFFTAIDPQEPAALGRQADEAFGNKQYDRAADLYGRLLALDPGNVELHNNLGLSLHYVGRSAEALSTLVEGVGLDPTHQRIWLTAGFVNAQLGRVAEARLALTNAITLDPNSDVGQSAAQMLANLPE
jgi:tetratricopeptide (TPR) repeat protein